MRSNLKSIWRVADLLREGVTKAKIKKACRYHDTLRQLYKHRKLTQEELAAASGSGSKSDSVRGGADIEGNRSDILTDCNTNRTGHC